MSSSAGRIFSTIGAGWTGSMLYANSDAVLALAQSVGTSALSTLATKPAAETAALQALAAQVAHLSALVAVQRSAEGGSRVGPLFLLAGAGTVGGLALHLRGLSFSDLMYTTRAQFKGGITTIGAGLSALSAALQRVKAQLTEQLDVLTGRVGDVAEAQAAAAEELAGARADLGDVATAISRLETKQAEGNRGIFLLCAAVQSLFGSAKGGADGRTPGRPELTSQQLRELQDAATSTAKEPFQCVSLEDQLASIAALTRSLQGCA